MDDYYPLERWVSCPRCDAEDVYLYLDVGRFECKACGLTADWHT